MECEQPQEGLAARFQISKLGASADHRRWFSFWWGTNDRYFRAYDASTGKVLWKFRTNSGVTAVPSTFAVDGRQYIAVQSGWGVDAQVMQGLLDGIYETKTDVPQGGTVWVFALPR